MELVPGRYKSIYHPSYFPERNWLKSQLLLWDSVSRIVPYSVQNQYGDDQFHNKYGLAPSFCPMVSPSIADLDYFNKHRDSISLAFKKIKKGLFDKKKYQSNETFGVNRNKAPQWIFDELLELGLGVEVSQKHEGYSEEYYSVHKDAGELILSCLAGSIAMRRDLSPITNSVSNFYLTAANEINNSFEDRPNSSTAAGLGVLLLNIHVPRDINKLSFADVLSLRTEYEDLRKSFHKTVVNISNDNGLNKIIDKKTYEEEITNCLELYNQEYDKFHLTKKKLSRLVTDWKYESFTVSLGGVGTYIAGGPIEAISVALTAAALSITGYVFSKRPKTSLEKSILYINKINKHIDSKEFNSGIKGLFDNTPIC